MITAEKGAGGAAAATDDRAWLREIVANERNSLDVDKFDYMQRDCYFLGVKSSYDPSRLLNLSRVIGDEVCYPAKEAFNLYEMFHTRYSLFKQVYTHHVSKSIEFMISDALFEANRVFRFDEAATDPAKYMHLTDSIVRTIEMDSRPELAASQDILKRLRRRELYKFCDELVIPPEAHHNFPWKRVSEADISACQGAGSVSLSPDDIIIHWNEMHYAMKDKDPLTAVHFFSQAEPDKKFSVAREKVSSLIPHAFNERFLRVFTRDPDKMEAVQYAFKEWARQFSSTMAVSDGAADGAAAASSARRIAFDEYAALPMSQRLLTNHPTLSPMAPRRRSSSGSMITSWKASSQQTATQSSSGSSSGRPPSGKKRRHD